MTTDQNKSSVSADDQNVNENSDEKLMTRQTKYGKIPITVWQIGAMMFLMNISFVMTYSFAGPYLKHIIGASMVGIGVLEGLCETVSYIMKLVSGILSDFFQKRKKIMVIGLIFSVISRPILAISTSFLLVFSAKAMERIGNGIQSTPRDAIVADVAPRKRIGASYGLKRSLAYIGSMIGAVAGIIAMKMTGNNYQKVFAIAAIPAVAAFLILVFFIKEPKRFNHPAITSEAPMPPPKLKPKFSLENFKYLGTSFWILMIVNSIYMLAKMNETFLILRMDEGFQIDPAYAPLVMIVFNLGATLASYPVGLLGDKLNRIKLLFIGIAFLMVSDIIMYSATTAVTMYTGIVFWGLQIGVTQNVFVSMIAEKVPEDLRGTGLGVFYLVSALSAFFADFIAGHVSNSFSSNHIFISSGLIGLVALLALAMVSNIISPTVSRKR